MVEASLLGRNFRIVRNGDSQPVEIDWSKGIENVQKGISEALNARNVAFLLGAGCSSQQQEGRERGIQTMQGLAETFCDATTQALAAVQLASETDDLVEVVDVSPSAVKTWLLTAEEVTYLAGIGVELEEEYARNLERLMEVLYSHRFVLQRSQRASQRKLADTMTGIINKVQAYLWECCTQGEFANNDTSDVDLYEKFYRKLVLRDRTLPRPWVFTTNYDLFNETAMDRLGIPYANGFSGVIERRFNPATFRYALAEQLDVTSRKWSAVDAFVYLCKLHGSVSWTEDNHGLFPIVERWPADGRSNMMIFPTPAKQNSSLGSPYADLFREFQSRVVREQSVLVTIGYGFGDEHLNNIIYQALTIPTFRLIIFASPDAQGEIGKLRNLGDPRIWIIGGDGPSPESNAHYFNTVVDRFMPQRPSERIDDAVRKVMNELASDKDEDQ